MKSKPFLKRLHRYSTQRGVAILTVLSVLVLMSVMVISFFSMAKNEQAGAKASAELNRNIALRDLAINLVIGRLRKATTEATQGPATWVSQPGAITVFKDGETEVHKLYSCRTPVAPSDSRTFLEDISTGKIAQWSKYPHLFVDLNRPVFKPNSEGSGSTQGSYHYPIVDASAYTGPNSKSETPEGFSYKENVVEGTVIGKQLPMPVRWLYVLQDGTVGTIDENGAEDGSGYRFIPKAGDKMPTKENPIVGRIAFWTDDESCKINVNTASEGVHWDTPHADTPEERYLATHQPPTGDYYRYPGHPAQVCLSSVLFPNQRYIPTAATGVQNKALAGGAAMQNLSYEDAKLIWDLAPMVTEGLSNGARVRVNSGSVDALAAARQKEHLLASGDELMFIGEKMTAAGRVTTGEKVRERLSKAGFFLTAKSNAPELNAWGFPRISMWPTYHTIPNAGHDTQYGTYLDEVLSFTARFSDPANSSLRNIYHIVRQDRNSRHAEFYVNGGGRNEDIWRYLLRISDQPVPGGGYKFNRFLDKYPTSRLLAGITDEYSDRNQILLEMVDWCRGVNMYEPSPKFPNLVRYGSDNCQHAAFCACGGTADHANTWFQKNKQTPKGQGRIFGASEIALWFRYIGASKDNGDVDIHPDFNYIKTDGRYTRLGGSRIPPGITFVQMGVVVEAFSSAHGFEVINPSVGVKLGVGTGNFTGSTVEPGVIERQPITGFTVKSSFAGGNINWEISMYKTNAGNPNRRPTDWIGWGGYSGLHVFGDGANSIICSEPIPIGSTATAAELTIPNNLRLTIFDSGNTGDHHVHNLVQVIYLPNPGVSTLRIPSKNAEPTWASGGSTTSTPIHLIMQRARTQNTAVNPFGPGDVVKSWIPGNPDYRLITAPRALREDVFQPHPAFRIGDRADCLTEPTFVRQSGQGDISGSPIKGLLRTDINATAADAMTIKPTFKPGLGVLDGGPWSPFESYKDLSAKNPYTLARIDRPNRNSPQLLRGTAMPDETMDFETGFGPAPDGGYHRMMEEGHRVASGTPYFDAVSLKRPLNPNESRKEIYSSPNRYISGPGMFGGISTGVQNRVPWQTLLFRPSTWGDKTANQNASKIHYGTGHAWNNTNNTLIKNAYPPDHLLLDYFWMPVVEPYPISDPFATKGKINLNYYIQPFGSYITRATALHALFKPERIMAIPKSAAPTYKTGHGAPLRHFIDATETLKGWEHIFNQTPDPNKRGDRSPYRVFRTASQICEMFLVPEGQTYDQIARWWQEQDMTGDNLREKPYANFYPRVTVRSNTYKIHYVAQTIQRAKSGNPEYFRPETDKVTSEYRGSAIVDRAIDVSDRKLASPEMDFVLHVGGGGVDAMAEKTLDRFYNYRIVEVKQFAP